VAQFIQYAWCIAGISITYLKVEIRDDIFTFLRSPGIISKESIPPAYVARARIFKTSMEHRNRFLGMNSASLCSLAARYDNPVPT
jgi:hypothetical protein